MNMSFLDKRFCDISGLSVGGEKRPRETDYITLVVVRSIDSDDSPRLKNCSPDFDTKFGREFWEAMESVSRPFLEKLGHFFQGVRRLEF